MARLKASWQVEYDEWRRRRFDGLELTYLWVDGLYVKVGLEKDKAAVLVGSARPRLGPDDHLYQFPQPHWRHLRTSNIVESPFCGLRLRTDAARRYKKVEHATAVLWKLLLVAERRFRRLNSPELLQEVFAGVQFLDGVRVRSEEAAA